MSKIQNIKGGGAVTPRFLYMVYYFIAAGIIVLDQIVKYAVLTGMYTGQTIPLVENVFHLTYVQSRGAAFSMWEQQWIILVALPAVELAAGLASIWIKRTKWSGVTLTSVAFICGGGIGNLIDRIARGYVVDMFDCRFIPGIDFPVFNVADIFICVGCGLLLLDVIFLEGKRAEQ